MSAMVSNTQGLHASYAMATAQVVSLLCIKNTHHNLQLDVFSMIPLLLIIAEGWYANPMQSGAV